MVKFMRLEVISLDKYKTTHLYLHLLHGFYLLSISFVATLNLIFQNYVYVVIYSVQLITILALYGTAIFIQNVSISDRINSTGLLVIFTALVTLLYQNFPNVVETGAAIFGVSAFIWLVFERIFKGF